MMALWPATKKVLSSDLENVGQGHHLQESLYFSYNTNVGQRHYISALIKRPTPTKLTKMMQLGLATKVSHQLIMKV